MSPAGRMVFNQVRATSLWPLLAIWTLLPTITSAQSQETLTYRIVEELQGSSFIGNVAYDSKLDEKYNAATMQRLQFRFLTTPKLDRNYFRIEHNTGVLHTVGKVDRDHICPRKRDCKVQLDVAVQPMQYFQIIKVTVEIVDVNDNVPRFPEDQMAYEILESAAPGSSFVIPSAVDPDSTSFGIQRYQLLHMSRGRKFSLKVTNKVDGSTDVRLILKNQLDREHRNFYQVKILAIDGGAPALTGHVLVNITVLDANDNSPKFNVSTYEVTIDENSRKYTTIAQLHADDPDAFHNGEVEYSFSSQTQSSYGKLFGINNNTGAVFLTGPIDYESATIYHLSVLARDKGPDSLPAQATVIVRVRDVNDHAPQITVNTLTGTIDAKVEETPNIGVFVAHISVVDGDIGSNAAFNCSLNSRSFKLQQIYPTEYKIITGTALDRETKPQYHLTLKCTDWGRPPLSSSRPINVTVLDENDHKPMFVQPFYTKNIPENNFVGALILQVNATDGDIGENAEISYKLHNDAGDLFKIETKTGIITANIKLDREQIEQVKFRVIAMDHGKPPLSSVAIVTVTVTDINDTPPKFSQSSYSFGVYENLPQNTEVGKVFATDADAEPYNEITFQLIPSRNALSTFAIESTTGKISTRKKLDREKQPVYYMVVLAANRGFRRMTSSVSVSVYVADKNDNAPVFDYPTPYNNTVYISSNVPVGYKVATLQASDRDIGSNSKVTFGIRKGNTDIFAVDPLSGAISVEKEVSDIEYQVFELTVEVKDFGYPQKGALQNLNVVVNRSIIFAHDNSHILSGHNFTIVVSLACVSGFITVILVIAIVIIRRQDRHAKDHKYNCRTEALKMLSSRGSKDSNSETEMGKALSNGECLSSEGPERPKKEVSFSLDTEETRLNGSPRKARQTWTTGDQGNLQASAQTGGSRVPSEQARYVQPPSGRLPSAPPPPPPPPGLQQTDSQTHPHGRPWKLTQKELEVHQLLQMLKQDQDAESACSGEASTTDSGRGASEEGDHGHGKGHPEAPLQHAGGLPQAHVHPIQHLHHPPSAYPHGHPQHLQPIHHVAPESAFSSNPSYSSQQQPRLQTFSPTNSLQRTHQASHGHNEVDNNNGSQGARNAYMGQRGAAIPPRPLKVVPGSDTRGHYMPFRNHLEDGEAEDSDASDSEGIKYSLDNVDNVLRNISQTPQGLQVTDFPDDATTTSGSYVLEVQDRDDSFFNDVEV